jgi:Mn-dependent DtxR family transcriptional regulator
MKEQGTAADSQCAQMVELLERRGATDSQTLAAELHWSLEVTLITLGRLLEDGVVVFEQGSGWRPS